MNPKYILLLADFSTHLKTLNYSQGTNKSAVYSTKDYLIWLENACPSTDGNVALISTNTETLKLYFEKLTTQANQKTGDCLSVNYLDKIRSSLQLFYSFLRLTQTEIYPNPVFPIFKKSNSIPTVLSKTEVQLLFKMCSDDLLGKRDRAILSLYYGCSLRRQEATNLNREDVDFDRGTLFISKSKTRQQRYVFMSDEVAQFIEDYVYNVREKLLDPKQYECALLVAQGGKRMANETVVYRFKKLVEATKNKALIHKNPSLHTLRHSIATHLLHAGMKLENIALFLGHKSLDSTQIYTRSEADCQSKKL